jgi:hypothetical protein
MAGLGLQPAGTSPAGFGMPQATVLIDENGFGQGSRRIDPVTRDYVIAADGRAVGMQNVQHLVHMAIHTDRTSSAVRDLGNELATIKTITANFEHRILSVLTRAVQHLIDAKLIEVLGFTTFIVGPDGGQPRGRAVGRFRFRDLTTDQEHGDDI